MNNALHIVRRQIKNTLVYNNKKNYTWYRRSTSFVSFRITSDTILRKNAANDSFPKFPHADSFFFPIKAICLEIVVKEFCHYLVRTQMNLHTENSICDILYLILKIVCTIQHTRTQQSSVGATHAHSRARARGGREQRWRQEGSRGDSASSCRGMPDFIRASKHSSVQQVEGGGEKERGEGRGRGGYGCGKGGGMNECITS